MTQVSSTGNLGFDVRSDERVYFNYPAVTDSNVDTLIDDIETHFDHVGKEVEGTQVTRAVLRTVVEENTFETLLEDPDIGQHIEAAAPLQSETGPKEYLAYFSKNAIAREVNPGQRSSFLESVNTARGLAIDQSISNSSGLVTPTSKVSNPDQLQKLWGDTFGWDLEGCYQFAERINDEAEISPNDRMVWFKGLEDEQGNLLASAMAERLDIPSTTGRLALIEHTEWATDPSKRGMKLGRRVVSSLIQDVKQDMAGVDHLIFAECNMNSGANVVAVRSGFSIPSVSTAAGREVGQVFYNNVRVDDGLPPHGEYRSFMFAIVE
jgi:hypothetical protein